MAAFVMLRTDYVDAVFEGLRKYLQVINPDGTYSFADVTQYTVKEGAFLGAKDINMMNTAMNLIMAALNNGTDLYEVFTNFFENQKELFKGTANEYNIDFLQFIAELKNSMSAQWELLAKDYTDDVERFEAIQEAAFNAWFDAIKKTLSSVENGELLVKIEKMLRDMYNMANQDDIDRILNEKYVDIEDTDGIFETATTGDIDDIIGGTYVEQDDSDNILTEVNVETIVNGAFQEV